MDENYLISFHSSQLEKCPWICIASFDMLLHAGFWGRLRRISEVRDRVDPLDHPLCLHPSTGLHLLNVVVSCLARTQPRGFCYFLSGLPNSLAYLLIWRFIGTHSTFSGCYFCTVHLILSQCFVSSCSPPLLEFTYSFYPPSAYYFLFAIVWHVRALVTNHKIAASDVEKQNKKSIPASMS